MALGGREKGGRTSQSGVMKDDDATLNALTVRRGDGNCEYGAGGFFVLCPAVHMLVHERPHLGWPSFDARLSAFAFLQGDDEFGALAVGDVEDARFPRVQRGHRGRV